MLRRRAASAVVSHSSVTARILIESRASSARSCSCRARGAVSSSTNSTGRSRYRAGWRRDPGPLTPVPDERNASGGTVRAPGGNDHAVGLQGDPESNVVLGGHVGPGRAAGAEGPVEVTVAEHPDGGELPTPTSGPSHRHDPAVGLEGVGRRELPEAETRYRSSLGQQMCGDRLGGHRSRPGGGCDAKSMDGHDPAGHDGRAGGLR